MKEKLLVLFLLVGLILVWGCGSTPTTQTNGRKFTLEYDHQESWTCFPWGLERPKKAFEEASTVLNVVYDNTTLTDSLIPYLDRFKYHIAHRQWDADSNCVYPGYLCGIKAYANEIGVLIDTIAGLTWMDIPRFSYVCGYVASSWNYRDKTAIHELGHQRARLSHLCLDEYSMNPDHNAEDCVMGNGELAICTGENLVFYPEFCPACRDRIKAVDW